MMRRWLQRAITRLPWVNGSGAYNGGGYYRSPMGILMTYEQALAIPAMDCGVKAISESFAMLPLTVLNGEGEEVEDHPIAQIFNRSPADYMNAFDFKASTLLHLLMYGNAYSERVYAGRTLAGLEMRLPNEVAFLPNGRNELQWRITETGVTSANRRQQRTVGPDDIFRVTALSYDTFDAVPAFRRFADTFGLSQQASRYALGFFLNSGRPTGVLTTDQEYMDAERMNQIVDGFVSMQSDRNAGRPALLFGGYKYQAVQTAPNESQFIEARYAVIEDVARILDISPIRLHHLVRSTYNNTRQEALNFMSNTITPWAKRFEAAIDAQLFTEQEQRMGYHCAFNLDTLRVESREDRYRAYNLALLSGWLTKDEVREFEGMEPLDVAIDKDSTEGEGDAGDSQGQEEEAEEVEGDEPEVEPEEDEDDV